MNTPRPHAIFVVGSCATRDAFPATDTDRFRLCAYHARSSLATLAGPSGGVDPNVASIASPFQRRMVQWDQRQQLKHALTAAEFDVLVLDLIDERFELLERVDGSVVTLSSEFLGVARRPLAGTILRSGCEAHVRLWLGGLEVLVNILRRRDLLNRVLVNRVRWAQTDAQGEALPGFSLEQIRRANQFLERLYVELERVFAPSAFIDYPTEVLLADRGHRWGCSPYHYVPGLYEVTRSRVAAFAAQTKDRPVAPNVHAVTPPPAASNLTAGVVVSTDVTDTGLTVSVGASAVRADALYAFYLFRGDTRVAQTGYGRSPSTLFPIPNIPGRYRVAAFVRDRASGKVDRFTGSTRRFPDKQEYDLERWGIPVRASSADQSLSPVDCVHSFLGNGTTSLDFLLQGFGALGTAPAILVCFSAAVSQRSTKNGPFFSGTSIGRRLGLPVICVADPTIARARDIALAWYAGDDEHPELPRTIARHLDAVAASANRPLVLLGGSGGGFAAMAVIRHLKATATAVACNPQTAIRRYHRQIVAKYIERAFPAVAQRLAISTLPPPQLTSQRLGEALASAGVCDDLGASAESGLHRSIILQNANDRHHLEHHLAPLLTAAGAPWSGPRTAHRGDGFGAWLGDWADGHAAPPRSLVESVVTLVAAQRPIRGIIEDLERLYGGTRISDERHAVSSGRV